MADDLVSGTAGARGAAQPCAKQKYRSNAHSQGLLDGLLMLRQGGILFDVVLLVEGKPIQAHRILLAASCDYFRCVWLFLKVRDFLILCLPKAALKW